MNKGLRATLEVMLGHSHSNINTNIDAVTVSKYLLEHPKTFSYQTGRFHPILEFSGV